MSAVAAAVALPGAGAADEHDGGPLAMMEASGGVPEAPDAQYVVLRVRDLAFISNLPGIWVRVEDGTGTFGAFAYLEGPSHDDARHYFIATEAAAAHYGIEAHAIAEGPHRIATGTGRICLMSFDDPEHCVAYGAFVPPLTDDGDFGDPIDPMDLGDAVVRIDFTAVSHHDWAVGSPDPGQWFEGQGNGGNGNGENGNGGNGENGNGNGDNGENGNGGNGNGGGGGGGAGPPGGELPDDCGCATPGGGSVGAWLLLAAALWRHRRRKTYIAATVGYEKIS